MTLTENWRMLVTVMDEKTLQEILELNYGIEPLL